MLPGPGKLGFLEEQLWSWRKEGPAVPPPPPLSLSLPLSAPPPQFRLPGPCSRVITLLRFSVPSEPGAADRFTGLEIQFYQFTQG